ncbi:MAG: type II methionyl aminopeptidase [Candidatus Bathyarchaeia archaeon]
MPTSSELEKLHIAGRIAVEVKRLVSTLVKEKMKVLDICEKVEQEIKNRGGLPAFPCNVGIHDISAHYTSPPNDDTVVPPNSIVKVDFGVHIDGYISDTAISVCFNPEYWILKQAAEEALANAIKTVKPGVRVSDVGAAIQRTIEKYGCRPIQNLTGHSLSRFIVHSGKHIPNMATSESMRIVKGDVFAIEPFATTVNGAGKVTEGNIGHIYRVIREKQPKDPKGKTLLNGLRKEFHTLPFAWRWVERHPPVDNVQHVFNTLLRSRFIFGYPTLVEGRNQPVGQAEHTVIVTSDGCEVITGD